MLAISRKSNLTEQDSPAQGTWIGELRRVARFVGLSGLGWVLDMAVYATLVLLGARVLWAALVGSLCGAAFAFVTSYRAVFMGRGRTPLLKLCAYLIYSAALVVLSSFLIEQLTYSLMGLLERAGLEARTVPAVLAKCLLTPFSLALNFLVARSMLTQRALSPP